MLLCYYVKKGKTMKMEKKKITMDVDFENIHENMTSEEHRFWSKVCLWAVGSCGHWESIVGAITENNSAVIKQHPEWLPIVCVVVQEINKNFPQCKIDNYEFAPGCKGWFKYVVPELAKMKAQHEGDTQ
jgi:hypothetical protein